MLQPPIATFRQKRCHPHGYGASMRGSQQIEAFGGLLVNEGYSARRNGAHGAIKIHGMIGEPHTQLVQGQDFTVLRQGGQIEPPGKRIA
jgi:hypothetical protein